MTKKIRQIPSRNYNNYKLYREELRREFNYSCVYCELTENETGGADTFQIDHYVPKAKYPELEAVYQNLFYSCSTCNSIKADYWPSKAQRENAEFYLNSFRHDVDLHISKESYSWKPLSDCGTWNIQRLGLNLESITRIRSRRATNELGKKTHAALLSIKNLGAKVPSELMDEIDACLVESSQIDWLEGQRMDSRRPRRR